MRVAYLTNQYPKTSHSFIRREIAGVEAAGIEVLRYSVRETSEPLVDPRDIAEGERTSVLLDRGALGLGVSFFAALVTRPARVVRALRAAIALSRPSNRGLLVHLAYLAEACRLRGRLERAGAQHLHVHFATNAASVALLCRELGGPTFSFTVHSTLSAEEPRSNAIATKLAAAEFACAVSRHGLDVLRSLAPADRQARLLLVRCGVDEEVLDAKPTPLPARPRLVCVARFSPEKGHATLLEAASLLAAEGVDFELVLVGDGPLRATLEAEVARLGLAERVRMAGWLAGSDVREAIVAARALVIPSRVEGLPVVAMEALALGRPVVASRVGGLPELVEDGVTGLLVPAGDAARLAEAMRWALGERAGAQAARGVERVRVEHDARLEGARLAGTFRALSGSAGEGASRSENESPFETHARARELA